jgi:autotransporter strand-loop-strand O-heptosyltransferase
MNILFLAPHLSTGGMPAFLLKRVEELHKLVRIYVVEYSDFGPLYVVHKNKIKALLPENQFFTLGKNKMELIDIIKNNNIDVVHVEEMVEGFESFNKIPLKLINALYANDRTWRMVETCHNVWFDPNTLKKMQPDAYAFVTPYHLKTFAGMDAVKKLIEFPIEKKIGSLGHIQARKLLGFNMDKKHVLNVGLWTSGKNQGEGIEIARKYPDMMFHFVGNQAPNFKDYWEPLMKNLPENVTVWGERDDVDFFMKAADIFMFNSTWECNPLVLREAIGYGLPIIARDLPQYGNMFTKYINPIDTDLNTLQATYEIPEQGITFAQEHIYLYNLVVSLPIQEQERVKPTINIVQNFVDQPFLEITGESDATYKVQFIDESGSIAYENTIKINSWIKLNRKYYTKWTTRMWENDVLIYENTLDLTNKRVLICVESKSLGDTIAWAPYALEFQKKHNCHVILSTFWNHMLDYPELEFVEPGTTVSNLYALYRVGWFFDKNKEPFVPLLVPMQKSATGILGLDFTEVKPKLISDDVEKDDNQICIAFHSTAQAKYWNNPNGWKELIDWLLSQGYTIRLLSKEGMEYMGNKVPNGVTQHPNGDIKLVMNELKKSKAFIGIGSGLSWLSWALDVPTVIISGFSYDWAEMTDCIRINAPKDVCSGCFNRTRLDPGDWNWCPDKRDFECTKSITSDMVISKLRGLLEKTSYKKPRIQIKHLLTKPEDDREQLSIKSVKQLEKYGMFYEPIINKPYDGFAPAEHCRRPEHISKDNKPGELYPGAGLGWITGRHYGCYLAHRMALESIDTNNFDYTLVFEADAFISVPLDEFVETVYKACLLSEINNSPYISFANNSSLEKTKTDELFSKTAFNQTLTHCYITPNREKQWWMDRIKDCAWDSSDLWFNHVFYHHPRPRYTTNKMYSEQADGFSLLDLTVKSST